MADALTGTQTGGEDTGTTLDFLGRRAPISFQGQPALPQVGGGPASLAATPSPSVAGAGVLAPPTSFGDIAQSVNQGGPQDVGGGSPGEGPGAPGVGQATDAAGGPANIGLGFGFGPAQITLGPTGTLGVGGRSGNAFADAAMSLGKQAMSFAGIPSSVNIPSMIATLAGSPMLGMVAQAFGAFGIPLTIASLAHAIASMSPTSVTSLQAALADPNPESQISAAQALALAHGGALGPTVGGVQSATGIAGFDTPALGPQGAQFGLDFSNPSVRSGFEANQDLHAPGVPPGAPGVTGPTAEGPGISGAPPGGAIGAGVGLGEGVGPGGVSSPGGPGPGPGDAGPGDSGGGDAGTGPF